MSDYEPGTVAMVTYNRERMRAFKDRPSGWALANCESVWESHLTDIEPLRVVEPGQVVIDATRDDADALQEVIDRWRSADRLTVKRKAIFVMDRIRDAIREQTPDPTPPKRWTVDKRADGSGQLLDRGYSVRRFETAADAQWTAYVLNGREADQ